MSASQDYGPLVSKLARGRRNRSVRPVNVTNLFSIVKTILLRDYTHSNSANVSTVDPLSDIIRKLSCKLACSCSIKNVQETVEEILGNSHLSKYDWDAIMVMAVAAFAANYGVFHVFVECSSDNNQVFRNIAVLKQLQGIPSISHLVGEIDKVMVAAVKMIDAACELMEHRRKNKAGIFGSVDFVVQAVCYTIRAVVICASLITGPTNGFVATEVESMLSNLSNVVIKTTTKALCDEIDINAQLYGDWQRLVHEFFHVELPSIESLLKALIKPDANGKYTLVTGNNPRREESCKEIKGENIFLLISGGYLSDREIQGIAEMLEKENKCKLVWIPISINSERFTEMQNLMNWYTVKHPSQVRPATVKFIKEKWMFQGQTTLVPLGQTHPQFYGIDWIWARGCFPGVHSPPLPLPKLSLSYLLSDIYDIETTPIVCLYGGEDLLWIDNFTKLLYDASKYCNSKFQLNMEFIYVSKSQSIDATNAGVFEHLNTKKFGRSWKADGMECWRFWTRAESFFLQQIYNGTDMKKDVMKEALTLLSHNASHKGWVVFGQYGTDLKLAQAPGNVAETVLKHIKKLSVRGSDGAAFIDAISAEFNDQVKKLTHHCSHVMLPAGVGDIGDFIACPICDKQMATHRYYKCCV